VQEETQNPGYDAAGAQEPNNAPDLGASTPRGSKGFGRNLMGEEPTAAPTPTDQRPGAFEPAASVGAEEAWSPFSPTELDPQVAPPVLTINRAELLWPEGPSAASLRTYSDG
jgi:hypothetical protein